MTKFLNIEHSSLLYCHQVCLMSPQNVYICDGSQQEADDLTSLLIEQGNLTKLHKMDNWYALNSMFPTTIDPLD